MHRASGVWKEQGIEDLYDKNKINILSELKRLLDHKYGDIIILTLVTAAFGVLLAASANG
jgi:hypothetical protein